MDKREHEIVTLPAGTGAGSQLVPADAMQAEPTLADYAGDVLRCASEATVAGFTGVLIAGTTVTAAAALAPLQRQAATGSELGGRGVLRVTEIVAPQPVPAATVHRWPRAQLERFAYGSPALLFFLIQTDHLRPADLAEAAELAGRTDDVDLVRATLVPLLGHEDRGVREGAVYGLSPHLNDEITARLRSMADEDESPGVREAALETLAFRGV